MMVPEPKSQPDFDRLVTCFDGPGVDAIVLMGSFARGDPGPFSDVDLVRFTGEKTELQPPEGSYLIDGRLVVASTARPAQVEEWFTDPEAATNFIGGLRTARALIDREGTFAAIQARAQAFEWDAAMQQKADAWVSREMVGWIEEVHKGLEGLRVNDVGRLLNARFGLSWGLSRVMGVHRGVLLSGDNAIYDEVAAAVGVDSEWARLRRTAYGIEDDDGRAPTLREQVVAGLRLYVVTVGLVAGALRPGDETLVRKTVELTEAILKTLAG